MEQTTNRSRRDFFTHVTALGVAGLVGSHIDPAAEGPGPSGGNSRGSLNELRPEDFTKFVGQTFAIHDGERQLEAELVKVERRRRGSESTTPRQPFSVLFRAPGSESVPHQIYAVEHPLMGRIDLFLGAVGQPCASSVQLEAVFA